MRIVYVMCTAEIKDFHLFWKVFHRCVLFSPFCVFVCERPSTSTLTQLWKFSFFSSVVFFLYDSVYLDICWRRGDFEFDFSV